MVVEIRQIHEFPNLEGSKFSLEDSTLIDKKKEAIETCKECSGRLKLDKKTGDRICKSCGLVNSEKEIDNETEPYRAYTQDQINTKAHYGAPQTGMSLGLQHQNKIYLRETNNPNLKRVLRQKFYQYTHSLKKGKVELKRICSSLEVPYYIMVDAFQLFKRVSKKGLLKSYSVYGFIGACLYYSSKKAGFPLFLSEVVEIGNASKKRINNSYRLLIRGLELKHSYTLPIGAYLPKILEKFNLGYKYESIIRKTLNNLPNNLTVGLNPITILASLIYIISKEFNLEITQKELSDKLNISKASIQNKYREFYKYLKIDNKNRETNQENG